MKTAQTGSFLSRLRELVARKGATQLPDRELLDHFVCRHEERAFEVLVERHGPLVLGVCRRLLHNCHDAEDAFQATFWALARKAGSIQKHDSLAGWLHQVAYRVSLRARERSATRAQHERQVVPPPAGDPLAEVSGRELLAVVDEELQHLPAQNRTALVLCYLEGKTRDEAAQALGWSVGTLRRRLEQGKDRLRSRLARRGLALPAALLAAGLAHATAVMPLLAATTARVASQVALGKAATGLTSTQVAALAEAVLKAMFAAKVKWACAGLIVTALVFLGAGAWAYYLLARADGKRNPQGQLASAVRPKDPATMPPPGNQQEKPRTPLKTLSVSGHVLDTDGKAVEDVQVAVVAWPSRRERAGELSGPAPEVLAFARAGTRGAFQLDVPRPSSTDYAKLVLLVRRDGYALGWQWLNPDAAKTELTVKLAREQVICGRLVDSRDQPAASVKVVVGYVGHQVNGELDGVSLSKAPDRLGLWPAPAITDAHGRFIVHGLNTTQGGGLNIRDERFAPTSLRLDPREPRLNLTATLAPAQIIDGTVVYADTGKPVPNARLTVYASNERYGSYGGSDGKADGRGRFHLNPLAGKWFHITAYAPGGEPYLARKLELEWPRGAVKQDIQLVLPRGILIRGKITETPSGQPVAGARIQYVPRRANNPHLDKNVAVGWEAVVASKADGTYAIPVLPGPGHLLVNGSTQDFIHQEIGSSVIYSGKAGGERNYPDALVKLDLARETPAKEVDLPLRRGVTVKGTVVGLDGKPVAKGLMMCRLQISPYSLSWSYPVAVPDGAFVMRGLDPKQSYPAYFLDPKNKAGIATTLSGRQAGHPVVVKLAPCGRAVARFVSLDGRPVAGTRPWLYIVVTPGPHRYDTAAFRKGLLLADEEVLANVDRLNYWKGPLTDARGRCTFPALIPGVTYRLVDYDRSGTAGRKDFTVESGKTLDLGDISLKRPH
jgi:RNA polymerase sigma factor (sigma-70 family)